ncbi:MAG: dihydrolipoyl dehydrogenase [SAR324 cluster bacterium]|nr:dihydrolipoyl dehydrogenase [SAR324 cluster bacterium]
MKELNVDVAIIGAGTAGMGAYRGAKRHAKKVVLIEGGVYGTTCARVGCMPSKLLISAAEAVHAIEQAPEFGIFPEGRIRIDGAKVMHRVKSERDRFVGFVLESVANFPVEDKIVGYATFVDDHTLQVEDHTRITANAIVIATGSSPVIPPVLQGLGDRLIINDDVFEWDTLPESVAVFGPGVIGLEIGQALHRLGVRVSLLGRGGFIGPFTDPALKEYSTRLFRNEFCLITEANLIAIERQGKRVRMVYQGKHCEEREEYFDYILAATGRQPNLDRLHLENTTLELNSRNVPVYDHFTMQCGNSSIFIAGDANHDLPLLHEAADEGRIAGENAGKFPDIRSGHRTSPLGIVFCDPQIATVGMRYDQLPGDCFVTGIVSFEDQGRSRVMLKNKGLLHLYAEHGTGIFMGAEMIGPRAENIGHLLAWAHQQKLTIPQMLDMPFYHPVVEEGLRTALRDANSKLKMGPVSAKRCIDCGPGA